MWLVNEAVMVEYEDNGRLPLLLASTHVRFNLSPVPSGSKWNKEVAKVISEQAPSESKESAEGNILSEK